MTRTDGIKLGVALVIFAIVSTAAETSRSAIADGGCWNLKRTDCCASLASTIDVDCGSWTCYADIENSDALVTSNAAASGWDNTVLIEPSGNESACEYYEVECAPAPAYCYWLPGLKRINCVDLEEPGVAENCS